MKNGTWPRTFSIDRSVFFWMYIRCSVFIAGDVCME